MSSTAGRRYVALWAPPLFAAVCLAASCGGGAGAGDKPSSGLDEETNAVAATTSATSSEDASRAVRESTALPDGTLLTTPSGEEVLFPIHNSPVPSIPGPSGRLVRDDAGCLRLAIPADSTLAPDLSGTSPTLLWPFSYSARFGEDGEVLILEENRTEEKRVVAREGDNVRLGSGYTASREELAESSTEDKTILRELFRRCPRMYYLTDGVKNVR